MTLIPPRRTMNDSEKRLMVLYAMSKLPGCNELQLLEFLFAYDLSNYIELRLTLHDLCAQGQAVRIAGHPFDTYHLTDAGKEAVELFKNRLPDSTVKLIDGHAAEWLDIFKRRRQYHAECGAGGHGELNVTMQLQDRADCLPELKIEILVPNHDLADLMMKNWEKQSGTIYRAILSALTEDA